MKNNFLLKNEDKSNQIDNVMSELFRYGVLEQEKEKLYRENKKEINNLLKESQYNYVSLFLNSYQRVPNSILKKLLHSLSDNQLFQMIFKSKSEELVREAYLLIERLLFEN